MLNIAKLGVGQEAYYLGTIAAGIEDYYTGAGEAAGYWWGGGLSGVGLERGSTVTPEQLRAVLGATHPSDGSLLLRRRVPGWDLAFRAPKSVSILYGLADEATSRQAREAHDAAVAEALEYLETEAFRVRRGKGGTTRLATHGVVAPLFRHRTSRAGDPQLHTHALVANLALGTDERWGALYSPQLYQHGKTAGFVYQAALRHELTRRLGVEWGPIENGCADIAGIPRPLLEVFSKRRQAITALLEERGEQSARAAQLATLATRQAKDRSVDQKTLRERWQHEAEAADFTLDRLAGTLHRELPPDVDGRVSAELGRHLAGGDGLTAHASTFTRRDVVRAACEELPAGTPVDQVMEFANAFLAPAAGLVVPLSTLRRDGDAPTALTGADAIRREDGRVVAVDTETPHYSTPELLALERAAIDAALGRTDEHAGAVAREAVEAALGRRPTMAPEQAQLVREVTTSGRGVDIVVGPAGTGKTFALDAARAAWQAGGYRVIGAALAAKAAAELEAGAGVMSSTLDSLLGDLERAREDLPADTVLVVDEAGMVGTRKMARLLDAAHRGGAKVVLVGDHRQLPEVDAGGIFRGLVHRSEHLIELAENRRQRHAWEIAALAELRAGDPATAVAAYQQHGRVLLGDTADEVRERLVDDWWEQVTAGQRALMTALRHADVDDLNARARAKVADRLSGPTLEDSGKTFQAGDEVVTLRNHRRIGVRNGDRWIVESVDPHHGTLQLAPVGRGDATPVHVPTFYLDDGHVDHAYATTIHKAQGLTVDWLGVLGSDALYREAGYVALSRGRHDNRLYVVVFPRFLGVA